jgi:peptidoglycan biosynthesis protein MviN/MurJ (putative lipid II flippase)
LNIFNTEYTENSFNTLIILAGTSIPLSLVNIFNTVRNAQHRVSSVIKINLLIISITLILSIFLIRIGIEGIAISYLIANITGAIIVILKMENPMEYTIKLIKSYKYIIYNSLL